MFYTILTYYYTYAIISKGGHGSWHIYKFGIIIIDVMIHENYKL